ncbi:hypothetical protein DFH27DRAFT_612862 [Peziza echinospora]|nr:hypothetical protein DFH27DRAFT_612862 [Peziza echinospora]
MSIAFHSLPSVHHQPGYTPYSAPSQYNNHMDRGNADYQSSTAPNPPSSYQYSTSQQPEPATSEQQSATYQQQPPQEVRSASSYTASATAPADYLNYSQRPAYPQDSHRGYPERYPPSSNGPSSGMNQSASPLPPLAHGIHRRPQHPESSEDPSIAAASNPPYPQHPQYPYQQTPEMSQAYSQQAGGPPQQQWRPDWPQPGYPPTQFPYGGHPGQQPVSGPPSAGAIAAPRTPNVDKTRRKRHSNEAPQLSQVYSFIPIPGSQQHKRPRRRYEEIERMYKCGWQGCEKAYGTLNHLNAHVTMQGHGAKRTPEEFKEIRKEWKARKKEEEAQRKAQEEAERARQVDQVDQQPQPASVSGASYPTIPPRQLPPLAYQTQPVGAPVHYGAAPSSGIELQNYAPTAPLYAGPPQYPPTYNHIQGQQYAAPRQQAPNSAEDDADAEPDPDVPTGGYTQ